MVQLPSTRKWHFRTILNCNVLVPAQNYPTSTWIRIIAAHLEKTDTPPIVGHLTSVTRICVDLVMKDTMRRPRTSRHMHLALANTGWKIMKENYDVIFFMKKSRFYEIFDVDADQCHKLLGFTWTRQGRGT